MAASEYSPAELKAEARSAARSDATREGVKLGMKAPTWTIRISDGGFHVQLVVSYRDTRGADHETTVAI